MVLAIDIGNTNIVMGAISEENGRRRIHFTSRISTDKSKTADQHAVEVKDIFHMYGLDVSALDGAIIASVVPSLSFVFASAIERVIGIKPMMVEPGMKTGLDIKIDNPAQLGSDIVVSCVAAIEKYPTPMCVIDLGTATTMTVVDNKNAILGCLIIPGIRISLEALRTNTSQLQDISLDAPKNLIGKNTTDSMKSGLIIGNAVMFDGVLDRIEKQLGRELTAGATGDPAQFVIPHCMRDIKIDDNLMMDGLYILYKKNADIKAGKHK